MQQPGAPQHAGGHDLRPPWVLRQLVGIDPEGAGQEAGHSAPVAPRCWEGGGGGGGSELLSAGALHGSGLPNAVNRVTLQAL